MVCGRVCLPWYVHQGGSNEGGEDVSKRPTWLILNLRVGVSFTDFILWTVYTHVIKEQFANMDRFNGIPSNPNPIDNPLQYRISDIGQASLGSTRFSILKDL